jgi:hypothetical protein
VIKKTLIFLRSTSEKIINLYYFNHHLNNHVIMAPPKRKRHAESAKAALEDQGEGSALNPKRQHLLPESNPPQNQPEPPTASQESLLRLCEDFHSQSEASESESEESEGVLSQLEGDISEGDTEGDKELDFALKNDHLDQDFGLPTRGELAEEEEDQSDAEMDLIEDFEASTYFRQSIIKGDNMKFELPAEDYTITESITCKILSLLIH